MSIQRTFEALDLQLERCPNDKAVGYLKEGKWQYYSTAQSKDQVLHYCGVLRGMGLKKGDFIAVVPKMVLPQWLFLDLAAQSLGIVVVSIHATSNPEQFEHILEESETKYAFFINEASKEAVTGNRDWSDRTFIQVAEEGIGPNFWNYWLNQFPPISIEALERIRETINPEDLATIIYTSGTTGVPKGVMLSHRNIAFNINVFLPLIPVNIGENVLSFLPYSHIFERNSVFIYLAYGMSIHMVGDRKYLSESFRTVQPKFFTAVPRILEKIYDQVVAYQASKKWPKRQWLKWAIRVGSSDSRNWWAKLQKLFVRIFIFGKIRRQLGGKLEGIGVGAAHLQPKLSYFFAAVGIKIREGYGLTEMAPTVSINRFQPGLYNYETAGPPVPGIEVKIHEPNERGEGEILVKGPNVMMGYYKQPELTNQVLNEDGWLNTGDIGRWVKGRFLQITDRKKSIFKTSAGKYIAPLYLENHFKQSDFIDQVMIIGFKRPYLVALVIPNFDLLEQWCIEKGIHWTSPTYMVLNIRVREKLWREVNVLNGALPNHQKVKNIHIIGEEWTVESQQLSPTQKLLRQKIQGDYQKEIEQLYSEGGK